MREAFTLDGHLIPEHMGYKANRRVNQGLCRDLTASHDEVAERYLFDRELIHHTLIKSLISPADDGNYSCPAKPDSGSLGEGSATG